MTPRPPTVPRTIPWPALERGAVLLLLLFALVPRGRDLGSTFDREFGGYQGAFFAIAAVNYERLGVDAFSGYPVLNIDLPGGSVEAARERTGEWIVYHNHPPTVPLIAWAAARAMGPEDWGESWRENRSPDGLEPALRLPFLLLHLLGLLAFWWLARTAFGSQTALIALALMSVLPVSAYYATLINYENPSLPFTLLAVACYGRYVRSGRLRELGALALAFAAGCSVTFAPAFFLPWLCLRSLLHRRWRETLLVGVAGGTACLMPILAHDAWAKSALDAIGRAPISITERARVLLGPLLEGEIPLWRWGALQLEHAVVACGWAVVAAAGIGFLLGASRALSRPLDQRLRRLESPRSATPDVDLALPLLAGGALYLFAFYRHTAEEQWPFLLYLAPGVVLLAARALNQVSRPLLHLHAGIAPLVVATSTIALPSLVRFEAWRFAGRIPGPRDPGGLQRGPEAPLPSTAGRGIAEVLPPGALGIHPEVLGLTPAASWYSWRSLWPVDARVLPLAPEVLGGLALPGAPLFLLLPDDPPPSTAETIDSIRESLSEGELAAGRWRAWRVN